MKGPPYPEPVRPWIHTRAGGAIALLLSALVAGCIGTETDNTSVPITRTSNKAPIVPGYESMRVTNVADDAALGEVLLGELNCLSCHIATGDEHAGINERITTKTAPDLSGIGQRVTPGWLAAYLADPQAQKSGVTMPNLFQAVPAAERESAVEQLTHFLISESGTLESAEYQPPLYRATVERGRKLFHSVGCVACHAPEQGDSRLTTPSVPLPDLAAKTSVFALTQFLLNPETVLHGGRMPSLYLNEEEATDIAVYLLREQESAAVERIAGFEFEYFLDPMQDEDADGFFTRPPPIFDELVAENIGQIDVLSLNLPIRTSRGNHMFRYSGLIPIETAGTYTFVLASDRRSGSELLIDGEAVATKGQDTGREITVEVDLEAGDHAVEVTYYIRGDTRQPYVETTITGGTFAEPTPIDRIAIVEDVRLAPTLPAVFQVDQAAAEQGAQLFTRVGCASCHELRGTVPDPASYSAPLLETLKFDVASEWHTAVGAPRYNLDDSQRHAIIEATRDLDQLAQPRDIASEVVHALGTYDCYACHQRIETSGAAGGPNATRISYFTLAPGLDLGDEGRIPPTLTGIGGKLKPEALHSVLTEDRMHVRRNYMQTRMPRFGGKPIATLAATLEAADATMGDLDEPPFTEQAIKDGRTLIGDQGMSCITCHDVGVNAAQGVSTINMATFYARLRAGWVNRLLRDPHSINTDTRMPSFWTGGSVIHPDIADGTVTGQINAIYTYLSLGSSMPIPGGMNVGDSMVLTPKDEPIIFRTFMTDVSPRAIVVGYPESVHVGFDANVMRLAKAWRGGFYDAQGTWSGRAGRFLDPYGNEVANMPPGPALAFLDNIDEPWPPVTMTDRNTGGRFMGYRLDDERRPIFMYQLKDIVIEEQPIPVISPGGTNLTRRFSLEAGQVSDDLYLLLAEGDEIIENTKGSWTIDGYLDVALRSSTPMTPIVRTSQGVQQLLLPVGIASNQTISIDVELSW